MMIAMRGRRYVFLALSLAVIIAIVLLTTEEPRNRAQGYIDKYYPSKTTDKPHPQYLPTPTWAPPPIQDPFPALATSTPPPIPPWNVAKKNLHEDYGLDYAPPLFIGFTRTWPLLIQAVVSYITAGWPADQIHVVENTGVQRANLEGKLTLQNPFYFNHEQLGKLGVNVVRAPVLMNFAQLQNFYVHLAHENEWPYYFWSHMDVLVLSYEGGENGVTPPMTDEGYKTVYELCLSTLNQTLHSGDKWADRFFAYDHLTLVNRAAYDDVGGWDSFIPYYMTDCDMHSRLLMNGWSQRDAKAGIITDVNTALNDLMALYRNTSIEPEFTDPNPPPPPTDKEDEKRKLKRSEDEEDNDVNVKQQGLAYYKKLQAKADHMWHYKHGDRDRNTWQAGQKGGRGEPFYYPARGIAEAIDVLTEAGREVYRRKWGHRDCDLIGGGGLQVADQWLVKQDW